MNLRKSFAQTWFCLAGAILVGVFAVTASASAATDETDGSDDTATESAQLGVNFDYQNHSYHLTYHNLGHTQLVTYSGEVMMTTSLKGFSKLEKALVPGKTIAFLIGASGGGIQSAYDRFESILRSKCPEGSCKITSYVYNLCASACIKLSMVGDDRVAARRVFYGFHRTYIGFGPFKKVIQSKKDFINTYVESGADPEWMERNADQLMSDQKDCVWVDAFDLRRAHIIDEVDSGGSVLAKFATLLPPDFWVLYAGASRPTYFHDPQSVTDFRL